jgi:hypothetical protein
MSEVTRARRSKVDATSHASGSPHTISCRLLKNSWVLGLVCATFMWDASFKAEAEPSGSPTADKIFFNCTFTTQSLNTALTISQPNRLKLQSDRIEASYIIIYVRQNRNDGQLLDAATPAPPPGTPPSYTGPVLCTNSGLDNFANITPTTEGTAIPATGTVDILGAEEVSHLQYRPTGAAASSTVKRVCHTVASKTQCFLIQP